MITRSHYYYAIRLQVQRKIHVVLLCVFMLCESVRYLHVIPYKITAIFKWLLTMAKNGLYNAQSLPSTIVLAWLVFVQI